VLRFTRRLSSGYRGTLLVVCLATVSVFIILYVIRRAGSGDTLPASVRIGYSPEPPFSFRTPNGQASGEAPEVARAVLRRVGVRNVEWVQTDFGLLIPELLSGRIDMIAAGMFITAGRARLVSFSRPTLALRQSLLVKRGNPKQIHRYEDFAERRDLKLCVLKGAIEHSVAVALHVPEDRMMLAPDAQTGVVAIQSGAVDGLALSSPSIHNLGAAVSKMDLAVATPFLEPSAHGVPMRNFSAFAFRPSDTVLRDRIDAQLEKFIGTSEHLAVIGPFDFGPGDLPGKITVAQVLARP